MFVVSWRFVIGLISHLFCVIYIKKENEVKLNLRQEKLLDTNFILRSTLFGSCKTIKENPLNYVNISLTSLVKLFFRVVKAAAIKNTNFNINSKLCTLSLARNQFLRIIL